MTHTMQCHAAGLNKDAFDNLHPALSSVGTTNTSWTSHGNNHDDDHHHGHGQPNFAISPDDIKMMWKEYTWAEPRERDREEDNAAEKSDFSSFTVRLKRRRGNKQKETFRRCYCY